MGNVFEYLEKPVTEKDSTDEKNDKLNCGTSTMQGWRVSQEDAHNCIIDYDKNTSYFAVYDGHGGRAVAMYCSQELPNFLKELDEYKSGDLEKALEEAFLKFDATLTTEEIITKLKELAKDSDMDDVESEDEENINNLYEEAAMPLEKVIEKYASNPDFKTYLKTKKLTNNSSSGDLPDSSGTSTSCTSENSADENSHNDKDSNNKNTKLHEDDAKPENESIAADSHEAAVSSTDNIEKNTTDQNGDIGSKQSSELSKSPVETNSTTSQENGEVAKKGKGKALAKTRGVIAKALSKRPKRTAKQIYDAILSLAEEGSEEESEDEKDVTFEGPNDDSSDEDDTEAVLDAEDNSSSSAEEDDEEEEEERDGEDEEDEEDEDDEDEDREFFSIKHCGSTAVVAVLRGNDLYVANAGDSRCVVCRNGEAMEMSIDHKPEDEIEESRIVKAGGYVSADKRVNAGLNLSRAIGDHGYKQNDKLPAREQMITALPDVKTLTIDSDKDEFMVLACDGIWNSMSSQEVVDFVKPKLKEGKLKLSQICEEMFDHCLAPDRMLSDGTGCDNMTAIIVQFKHTNEKRSRSASVELEESNQCKKLKTDETEIEVAA